MSEAIFLCDGCQATLDENKTCEEHFHQMLFWEAEYPAYGVVHHLMVLCYHLQHPALYSPEGLQWAITGLVSFVEEGAATEAVRRRNTDLLDSGNRKWKVKGNLEACGKYIYPVKWTMNAGDVISAGHEAYIESVTLWAESVLADLRASRNID
jgi:hypothetical protein